MELFSEIFVGTLYSDWSESLNILFCRILEETSCVPSTHYQPAGEPEVVQLTWKSEDGAKVVTKSFVLDNGRLQLEPVKQAFALATVELFVGRYG